MQARQLSPIIFFLFHLFFFAGGRITDTQTTRRKIETKREYKKKKLKLTPFSAHLPYYSIYT